MVKSRNYFDEEKDFAVNNTTAIKNFKYTDKQIYEKPKYGGVDSYRKFEGSIIGVDNKTGKFIGKGEKVRGFVSLSDDNIRDVERIEK